MKSIAKIAAFIMALCFVLGLVACGGSETDTNKDNSTVSSKNEPTSSVDVNSTITASDLEIGDIGEEKATFVLDHASQTMTIEAYHKDNELRSFTMTLKVPFGDQTEEEMKTLKDQFDKQFDEASKKDYISYSSILANNELSVVIAVRDLTVREHKEYMVDLHLYDGYTADDTYEDFEEYLLTHDYVKQ